MWHCRPDQLRVGAPGVCSPRAGHVRSDCPPRTGRIGRLDAESCRPGSSPAGHHRPERGRRAADVDGRRADLAHVQRRNLQLPGASIGARSARPSLPEPYGQRGHSLRVSRIRRGVHQPPARHVRVRDLGRATTPAAGRARSSSARSPSSTQPTRTDSPSRPSRRRSSPIRRSRRLPIRRRCPRT